MDIYLVGAISANLKPILRSIHRGGGEVDIFLAGCYGRLWCIEEWYKDNGGMDLFIAGLQGRRKSFAFENATDKKGISILESFYYADEFTEKMIPHFGKFLLDSGAFTMLANKGTATGVNWEEYIDRYADFIVRNKVERFFELDIDKIIGYDRVIALRNRLEKKTGRQAIPVWHKYRGKDNFLRMCDEYKYVAIGGIVTKEIQPEEYKYFPWLISEAHRRGAKIHGLGFTAMKELPRCHFDSVDSTAWTTGNRFGMVYEFDGRSMVKHKKGKGQCLKDSRAVAIHNFNEWVKFQKWAETHL